MNARGDLPAAREVCPTTTRRLLAEGALLVDVRERAEVARMAFDVPALVQVPLSEFEQRFDELPRDRPLVLACESGPRSLQATYYLMYRASPTSPTWTEAWRRGRARDIRSPASLRQQGPQRRAAVPQQPPSPRAPRDAAAARRPPLTPPDAAKKRRHPVTAAARHRPRAARVLAAANATIGSWIGAISESWPVLRVLRHPAWDWRFAFGACRLKWTLPLP